MSERRRVRRPSKFRPGTSRGPERKEDHLVSVCALGLIQVVLFVFLLVGAYRGFTLMRGALHDLGWYIRWGLPLVMVGIALFVLKAFIDNVKRVVEIHKKPPTGG
jgi:hypothetical protein